ncbi:hypothetical protein MVES1_000296 [Malassezia vespertilionis]|uniref:Inner centromere protein ARK-binding domain-containing protein n=1 Tax=Malassezia vespertilionis TaxID=2020962 RepID=A0A2N1JGJ4_9BASI|nr:uncharacterized protein MVES1_000296 [Malassezia vespertilionis]PKI85655.1 hypothetical protein MVES_000277 [Malassezia vespertilionis]WFD04971.1 hypothetical protein MVES1_000296 [Malassezia vespertilionis]
MPPRKKAAVRAAVRGHDLKRAGKAGSEVRDDAVMLVDANARVHQQVVRNAYIIAESQLLLLAKQLEFDVDVSVWAEEVDEKMAEFWEQTSENVDVFCARMADQEQDTRSVIADVVKSPRKRDWAYPTQDTSPALPLLGAEAREASSSPRVSEPLAVPSPEARKSGPLHSPHSERTVPSPELELDARLPLPLTTPGAATRPKRALSSAVLRSAKKPELGVMAPGTQASKTSGKRFRSSFLNKSLHNAIAERQVSAEPEPELEPELEHSPLHERRSPVQGEQDTKDTKTTPTIPSELLDKDSEEPHPRTAPGQLDALRSRLESVRRTSTVPSAPNASRSRLSETRHTSAAIPAAGSDVRVEMLEDAFKAPSPPSTPARQHIQRSPSRLETPGSRLPVPQRSPSRLARPESRAGHTPHPERSPSRAAQGFATPWRRAHETTKPVAPSFMQRAEQASPRSKPTVSPVRGKMQSPGRLREELLSPFRTARPADASRSPSRVGNTPLPGRTDAVSPRPHSPMAPTSPVQHSTPGFGARIRGLFGLHAQKPASPQRSASAMGAAKLRPASPDTRRKVRTVLGTRTALDDDALDAALEVPNRFSHVPANRMRPAAPTTHRQPVPGTGTGNEGRTASHTSRAPSSVPRPASATGARPAVHARALIPPHAGQARKSAGTRGYTGEEKRRKVLRESTNQTSDHPITEDALKSKLTTASGVHTARVSKAGTHSASLAANVRPASRICAPAKPPVHRASGSANVFQQAVHVQSDVGNQTNESLPDVQSEYSDSDDEASIKKRKHEPSWTRGQELEDLLIQQASIDPDEIFGQQMGPVPLDTMLPPRQGDRRRARHRTSSANWGGPDGLAQWEVDRYNERMGIHVGRTT